MKNLIDSLLKQLGQNSTWRGIILLLTSLGVTMEPAMQNHIVAAGLALVGIINVLRR